VHLGPGGDKLVADLVGVVALNPKKLVGTSKWATPFFNRASRSGSIQVT
jgi:hypothetical protein